MATKIKVLDHGFVRLVSYMQPVPNVDERTDTNGDHPILEHIRPEGWSGDLEIVRNARVSFNADWRTGDDESKDEKLIGYMYNNQHTTPFEAMVFTFEIKCPLFIARQWHRHRVWSFNEISARYTELPEDFYIPKVENITTQDKSNKQARTTTQHPHANNYAYSIKNASEFAFRVYKQMLEEDGCPRELARLVLPVNTYTRYFGTVNLHNLIKFCLLRSSSHAQWEIQQYSNALIRLVKPICPVAVGHLIDELYDRQFDNDE